MKPKPKMSPKVRSFQVWFSNFYWGNQGVLESTYAEQPIAVWDHQGLEPLLCLQEIALKELQNMWCMWLYCLCLASFTRTYTHIYIYIYLFIYLFIYIYIHIHTYIHNTYICKYISIDTVCQYIGVYHGKCFVPPTCAPPEKSEDKRDATSREG